MSGAAGYLEERFRDIKLIGDMTEPEAVGELVRALKVLGSR